MSVYCKENLCNTENGRMIVELYLGKQGHHILRNLVLNRAAALKRVTAFQIEMLSLFFVVCITDEIAVPS